MQAHEWEYVQFEPLDLEGALLVVGIPSVGMVGPLAAGFLTEHLGMRLIGGFQSDSFPAIGLVRKGFVTSPVQVWATELACGPDGACDRLLVLRSDVEIPAETLPAFAGIVARWAASARVGLVVGLEGYPTEQATEDRGVLVAASLGGASAAKEVRASPVREGALVGYNATLLVRANAAKVAAIGLFAPTAQPHGDSRAAAALLEVVEPLVPNIGLSPDQLLLRSQELETRVDAERRTRRKAERRLAERAFAGYA